MTTITVKNIPDETYERLKQQAAANHRSINGELLHLIKTSTQSSHYTAQEQLDQIRAVREKTAHYFITDQELNAAKQAGRS